MQAIQENIIQKAIQEERTNFYQWMMGSGSFLTGSAATAIWMSHKIGLIGATIFATSPFTLIGTTLLISGIALAIINNCSFQDIAKPILIGGSIGILTGWLICKGISELFLFIISGIARGIRT